MHESIAWVLLKAASIYSLQENSARQFSFHHECLDHVSVWDASAFLLLRSNCFQQNHSWWKIDRTFVTYSSVTESSHRWELRCQPAASERPGKPHEEDTVLKLMFIGQTSELAPWRKKSVGQKYSNWMESLSQRISPLRLYSDFIYASCDLEYAWDKYFAA